MLIPPVRGGTSEAGGGARLLITISERQEVLASPPLGRLSRHCEEQERRSNPRHRAIPLDCFATLARTKRGLRRRTLRKKEGEGPLAPASPLPCERNARRPGESRDRWPHRRELQPSGQRSRLSPGCEGQGVTLFPWTLSTLSTSRLPLHHRLRGRSPFPIRCANREVAPAKRVTEGENAKWVERIPLDPVNFVNFTPKKE